MTVFVVDPATNGTNLNLTTNVNQWGFDDTTDYKGVSFVVSKRWSNNWQVLASYDYGKGYQTGTGTTPNGLFNSRHAEVFGSRPHNFKFTGNYLIAEPIGVNLGAFVRAVRRAGAGRLLPLLVAGAGAGAGAAITALRLPRVLDVPEGTSPRSRLRAPCAHVSCARVATWLPAGAVLRSPAPTWRRGCPLEP